MKTTLLLSSLAVGVLFAAPAGALTGGPGQFAPPYPYPTYCAQCWGHASVNAYGRSVARRSHRHGRGAAESK